MFIYFLSLTVDLDFHLSRTEVMFGIGDNNGNTISVFVDVLDDLLVEGTETFTLSGAISTTKAAPGSTFVGGVSQLLFLMMMVRLCKQWKNVVNWINV